MTPDPYTPYLHQADELFAKGDIVKAGQIWQAILKQHPAHVEARNGLLLVKARLLAQRDAAEAQPPAPPPAPTPAAAPPAGPFPEPVPEPEVADVPEPQVEAKPSPEAPLVPEPLPPSALSPVPEPGVPPVPLPPSANPRATAPETTLPVAAPSPAPEDLDRLLAEGCTLYDMGQLQDALRKWERILAVNPAHALARGYANGARRELGLPGLDAHAEPDAAPSLQPDGEEDLEKLLREAVQLYDMGLVEEAISKWERVLWLDPQRLEVEGYLRQARAEVRATPSTTSPTGPDPTGSPEASALDLKLRQAEHLLQLQRNEEAAFTFQQALGLDPGNARALQGLERCRRPGAAPSAGPILSLDPLGRIAMVEPPQAASTEPQAVEPPAALLKAVPAPRTGLSLPDRLREAAQQVPGFQDPKVLAAVGGGLLVVAVTFGLVRAYRRDQALKDDVRRARAAAVAPVAKQAQAPDLTESPEAIQDEVEATLVTDPLRAYLRAETLVARQSSSATGAQLLEKARAGLPGGVTGASLPEFQKHLQNGDLETAARVIDALLRAQPGSADLRRRAGRLHQTLAVAHASQGKWEAARDDLRRGRALFPDDKTWQARLKLLERVKTLPNNQQEGWISLLG